VQRQRRDAAGEFAAVEADQLGAGEVEERRRAAQFKLGCERAAKIAFDHRPAERTQLIGGGVDAARVAERARLGLEPLRVGKRQEQLVVMAERQPGRSAVLSGSAGANRPSSAAISALGRATIAASAAKIPRVVSRRMRRPRWSTRVTAQSRATSRSAPCSATAAP